MIRVLKSLENSTPFCEQKCEFFSSTSIDEKQEQKENAFLPIEVREAGRVIEVKREQQKNALSPIKLTELERMIEVKREQLENAKSPIEVTESGRMIELKL